ncbi:MAG: HD domain-containing protein [Bryobacteraceae bacterium]
MAQPPEFHPEGDVWTHTLIMLDGLTAGCSATLAMGVLLHDVGKPPTFQVADRIRFNGHVEAGVAIAHQILTRLRFSKNEIEQIEALVANHMRFKDVPQMRQSTLKRFLRMDSFEEHLELHRLDCESSHGLLGNYELVREQLGKPGEAKLAPPRLVTGRDLIDAGYTPGPDFSRVLEQIEDAQLENRVTTREEGLKLAQQLMRPASEPAST